MSTSAAGRLYSRELLSLAVSLDGFPLDQGFNLRAKGRSKTCGSRAEIGIVLDPSGQITRIGMQVTACAVGQASAALLARGAVGRRGTELAQTHRAIRAWLKGDGRLPGWPQFDLLAPAREFPGRHGALLLGWKTAVEALRAPAMQAGPDAIERA